MLVLVDCNNFFVSAERAVRPELNAVPVAVLGSNDGCIIARSNEVKALGIPMAAPVFQYRQQIERHRITLLSANFDLYAQTSAKVMAVLRDYCPHMQVYSIDEAFLDISDIKASEQGAFCQELRAAVFAKTGIPVSVGIAGSKTLAKLANALAKKQGAGCCYLHGDEEILLQTMDVGTVWGIGKRLYQKLHAQGIENVWQLRALSLSRAKSLGGVNLQRSVRELSGECCLPIVSQAPARQQIRVSRTFGSALYTKAELKAALHYFAIQATIKLRHQHSNAGAVRIFIASSRFQKQPFYQQTQLGFNPATADYQQIIHAVSQLLARIFQQGIAYKQAGVQLQVCSHQQLELPLGTAQKPELATTIDAICQKFGAGSISAASSQRHQPANPPPQPQEHRVFGI